MMGAFVVLCFAAAFVLEGVRRYLHVHEFVEHGRCICPTCSRRREREARERQELERLERAAGFEPSAPWPWRSDR